MIELATLKRHVNAIARTALAPVPLDFWRNAFPKDLIALCYHVVSDDDLAHLQLYPYKNTAQFEADLLFARSRAVTYAQVAARRLNGTPLPRNSMLITFDDGLAQCYDVARPVLLKHGIDAVFFVTTDYVDDREMFFETAQSLCATAIAALEPERAAVIYRELNAGSGAMLLDATASILAEQRLGATRLHVASDPTTRELLKVTFGLSEMDPRLPQICGLLGIDVAAYARRTPIFLSSQRVAALVADGFTVGAHGRKHRSLVGLSNEELEHEIVSSCEAVRALTGQVRVPFAFPYSGLAIDRETLARIMRRNPIVELIFDSGCLRNDPQFIVNRIFADAPAAFGESHHQLSNVPDALCDAWATPSAWFRS